MLGNDRAASQAKNEITIFSPSDDAMNAFKGKKPLSHQIIMNSMGTYNLKFEQIVCVSNIIKLRNS